MTRAVRNGALAPALALLLAAGAAPAPVRGANFADDVDAAVAAGRTWLLGALKRGDFPHDNFPMGIRSLYLYALLKAGADPNEPAIAGTLAAIERMEPSQTYSTALHLMALDRWARARARVKLLGLGEGLREFSFLGEKRARAEQLLGWLLEAKVRGRAHWTYTRATGDGHDYSNSQFAVLGIEIALRSNLKVPEELLTGIAETFAESMGPSREGRSERVSMTFRKYTGTASKTDVGSVKTFTIVPNGWGYTAGSNPTFSMTCAGLSNLAVARWGLDQRDRWQGAGVRRIEDAMHGAMAWIAIHYDGIARMRPGPGSAHSNYYYTAYSLEKAGDLADVARFGGHDWYREEAEFLLRDQREDGRWGREGWEGVATSFSLLFLVRATARYHPLDEIVITGPGSDRDRDPELVYIEKLRGRVSIGAILWETLQSDEPEVIRTAEEAVDRFLPGERGLLVPTLAVLAESGLKRTQTFAVKALRAITGVPGRDFETLKEWCTTWDEVRAIERARDRSKSGRLAAIARSAPWDPVRVRAIEALERVGGVEVAGELIPLLEDKSATVRERVVDCLRFFSAGAFEPPASSSEADRRLARERAEAWFRGAGLEIVRKRKVEAALAALLEPAPPAYAEDALAVLRECPLEAVPALLDRLTGPAIDYRIFLALRAVTGEDWGLDPAAWRQRSPR